MRSSDNRISYKLQLCDVAKRHYSQKLRPLCKRAKRFCITSDYLNFLFFNNLNLYVMQTYDSLILAIYNYIILKKACKFQFWEKPEAYYY
jgi:hypothetical protein